MVKFFLNRGADPNIGSVYGETPLHLAICRNLLGLDVSYGDEWTDGVYPIEYTLDISQYDSPDSEEYAAACDYVVQERDRLINTLLDHPATNVNLQNCEGTSPLHLAVSSYEEHEALVKEMLRRTASISLRNSSDETPLHLACLKGYSSSVSLLLAEGADPSLTDKDGRTALHCAARSGDKETVTQILCASGAHAVDLCKTTDHGGQTPLHHACDYILGKRRDPETVRILVDAGADPDATDEDGDTPLAVHLSSFWGADTDVCRLLLRVSRPGFVNNAGLTLAHVYTRCLLMEVATLLALQEAGVDLAAADPKGRTMLHHVSISGWLTEEVLEFLLGNTTLRTDAADADGRTPIQYAAEEAEKSRDWWFHQPGRWRKTLKVLRKYGGAV
jgi:ankyrin repeat protein